MGLLNILCLIQKFILNRRGLIIDEKKYIFCEKVTTTFLKTCNPKIVIARSFCHGNLKMRNRIRDP